MFVVVHEGWGHITVYGPFDTKRQAEDYCIESLIKEMLPHWGEPWATMSEQEVRKAFREEPFAMFEDTDQGLAICKLEAPSITA